MNATTASASPSTSSAAAPRFSIDPAHSGVSFKVRHMMISNVRGEFGKLSGTVTYDPARPDATRIEVSIDTASINTREEKRDAHLRSADFLDVERFPAITFHSTAVTRRGAGLEVAGELTIRGTTRPVTLAVEEITGEHVDPWGHRRIGATAETKIKRSDFGVTWNAALEAGGVLVGDEITVHIELELIKQS